VGARDGEAVAQVVPERDFELGAGFGETEKGIAAITTDIAESFFEGAGRDAAPVPQIPGSCAAHAGIRRALQLDALKFMKVDVLGLGMLGCMRRAFDLLDKAKGMRLDLATIPAEDPATYAMIRKADTVGTFQIESRAQMAMLPRLKPKTFYDLVIEVAIVRPGPHAPHI